MENTWFRISNIGHHMAATEAALYEGPVSWTERHDQHTETRTSIYQLI